MALTAYESLMLMKWGRQQLTKVWVTSVITTSQLRHGYNL